MDGSRFDDLTRALAHGLSRRGALKILLGGVAAGIHAVAGGNAFAAAGQAEALRKPPGFERLGKRCDNGQPCGVYVPCSNGLYCTPAKCWIGGQVVDDQAVNDDNPCQHCVANEHNRAWARWSRVRNGTTCPPGESDNPCLSTFIGTCQSGECVAEPVADGAECGPGQTCCQGNCCAAGVPCNATTGCGGCDIGGTPVAAGAPNLDNVCQACDALVNPAGWSPAPGNPPCGDDLDRVCCNGECCPPDRCCSPAGLCEECCETGDGERDDGSCEPGCEIAGEPFDAGAPNPTHDCEICDPDRNPEGWSPVDDQTGCGGVPGRVCCNGECCSPTECCNPTGFCEECGPHCRIDGQDVDEGVVNPANPCEACDPEIDLFGWSPGADGSVCGGDLDGDLVCCQGACCGADLCCVDGACGACQCEIDGRAFEAGETEPGNECQACSPELDQTGWTSQPPNFPCGGLTDGRYCCEGVCCPSGECCNPIGECEPCGCVIDGDDVFAGSANPTNTCEVCDPDRDRFTWTILGDEEACGGDGGDRVCCGGSCCAQGDCCDDGTCQACGCEIAGATYEPETINPQNSCQLCDPSRARLDWSPVIPDGGACGAEPGQTCCGGDCCEADECCLLGVCGTCLCVIEGENVAANTSNPANACEFCDPARDPFAWTVAENGAACGDGVAQVCCAGLCCPDGECCSAAGVCEPCGCMVEGESHVADAPNPANVCEVCDPDSDPSGWSPVPDDSPCGDAGDRVCCLGACCAAGECCTAEGICGFCGCQIEGESHAEFALNPANECEWCDPDLDPLAWSPISDSPCAEGGAQVCCDGVCCAAGDCCNVDGQCEACGCTIDGVDYPAGTTNPAQDCQACDPDVSRVAWTPRANNEICGANSDRACCDGTCCTGRGCCVPGSGGMCDIEYCGWSDPCEGMDPCGCTIDGAFHEPYALNPGNVCQHCEISTSTTAWSPVSIAMCGPNGDRFCSGGVCCDLGICPDLGANTCGDYCDARCVIGGVLYVSGDRNPANPCEVCAPSINHTAWSFVGRNSSCVPFADSGPCCDGTCCGAGSYCSDAGVCVASGS